MSSYRIPLIVLLSLMVFDAPSVRAEKLDKSDKKWLEEVAAIILPEEQKAFESLRDKSDRPEFQKIFWARRNPEGPAAAQNPAKAEYDRLRVTIEKRFRVATRPATTTDCARVFALLGEPADIRQDLPRLEGSPAGSPTGSMAGGRQFEEWTYKDRPGFTFKGGQIQVRFDEECRIPDGGKFIGQLRSVAEARIANPNIAYRTVGGRLVKLQDQLPKPSPVQTLLKEPKQDFPMAAERKLTMRGMEGATYVSGLMRVDPGALTVQEETGAKRVSVLMAAQAVDETGKVIPTTEQEASAELAADGHFVGSFGLTLKPGKYLLKAAVFDPTSSKGSVATTPLEVPDFAGPEASVSEPIILADVQERSTADPKNPLASFLMGQLQLVPRFQNRFARSDAIQILAFVYNGQTDPASGKPRLGCQYQILRDGKPVAQASEEQLVEEVAGTPGVGPIPLTKFPAGQYVVRITVVDKVAQKEHVKETAFEVQP